ncbi:MAG TPA: hypothetical protein ENO21_04310, partial [Firmicutes bacterium]|nr:hypothetical protein [Bacillota bacterium]
MIKRKQLLAAMALATPFLAAAPAHSATILLDDWDLLASTVEAGASDVLGIDQITFNAIVQADTDALAVGSIYDVTVLGTATSFIGGGGIIGGTGLNDSWELTFRFDGQTQITSIVGDVIEFGHLFGGVLDFYIDDFTGTAQANTGNAASYTDGTMFARFIDDGTGLGVINADQLDGADDFSADLDP